jgi:hypothetical protein
MGPVSRHPHFGRFSRGARFSPLPTVAVGRNQLRNRPRLPKECDPPPPPPPPPAATNGLLRIQRAERCEPVLKRLSGRVLGEFLEIVCSSGTSGSLSRKLFWKTEKNLHTHC